MDEIKIIDLWRSFQSYVNTFQGGWYRPQSDFEAAVNDIQNEVWVEWVKDAEKSTEVKDNLRNFLKTERLNGDRGKGNFITIKVPENYARFSSARIVEVEKALVEEEMPDVETDEEETDKYYEGLEESQVKLVDNDKWAAALTHKRKKPSLKKPIMTQVDGGFKVSPRSISTVVLDYYIKPPVVKFAYDKSPGNPQTGAGDQIVYNGQNSKHLQWPTTMINEFIIRLGSRYSLFTRSDFMAQYTAKEKSGL